MSKQRSRFKTKPIYIAISLVIAAIIPFFAFQYHLIDKVTLFFLPIGRYAIPRINFDTISLGFFTISIAYPALAQYIRNLIGDVDGTSKKLHAIITSAPAKTTSKLDEKATISDEKAAHEQMLNELQKQKKEMQLLNVFSEFKWFVFFALIFMLLSAMFNSFGTNNILYQWYLSPEGRSNFDIPVLEATLKEELNIVLVVDYFMLTYLITVSIFMFYKIYLINGFLRNIRVLTIRIHDLFNKPEMERVLEEFLKK